MPDQRDPPDDDPVLVLRAPDEPVERAAAKREALAAALERGRTQIRLDARRPGVRVPGKLDEEFGLALNLSWRFPHAQMLLNERGIAATLRFAGTPFRCVIPWSAVWGYVPADSGRVHVWVADLPPELGGPARADHEPAPPPVEAMRPRLSVIETAPSPEAADPEPDVSANAAPSNDRPPEEPPPAPAGGEKPKAPWLKLVR